MIYACNAAMHLAQKLASKAENMAAVENHPYRKAELQEAAAMLKKVPAYGASSFKEACQSFYFFQLALHLENGSYAVYPGGFDKLLYSFYQQDITRGVLTPEQAYEIVECLWLKLCELSEVRAPRELDGYPMFDAMLHGVRLDDPALVINDLSAMLLAARSNLMTLNSNLQVKLFAGQAGARPQYSAPSARSWRPPRKTWQRTN
ncbi:4-hydroxyphenylacetate decarboxylase large subunit [Serratia fonticola]|uniref:4-hydroxyphenylacetate decarboxylase large subunit n=1 Tax=Serratia fonticola TaxID=47917 RepID=A0A4U9TK11_SERFO|nr:4-hydroxyphenylacetate decarboxylase large subunit [Serratia fonticola]